MNTGTNLLKDLIIQKYGTDKFETGCLLFTQWLNATTTTKVSLERIQKLTEGKRSPHFTRPQQEAIRKLFGTDYVP